MKIGPKGIWLIEHHEEFRSRPYLCPAGIPTIGYGSTYYPDGRKVTLKDKPITEQEATVLMQSVLKSFELCVTKNCPNVNQNQFDALVDFAYNVGVGKLNVPGCGFQGSTLLKKVKANPNDPTIRAEFMKWNKGGGKVLAGLTTRRTNEANLYFLPL